MSDMMDMQDNPPHYICKPCADKNGVTDIGFDCVNDVGRKMCSWCGDNPNPIWLTYEPTPTEKLKRQFERA